MIKKLLHIIAGSDNKFSVEHRMFNFVGFMFLVSSLFIPILLDGLFRDIVTGTIVIIFALNCISWFLISRLSKKLKYEYYYLISTTVFLSLFFLFSSHYTGPFSGLIAVFLTFAIILSQNKYYNRFILFFFLVFPTVLTLKRYIISHPVSMDVMLSINSIILQIVVCIFLFIGLLCYRYYFEREKKKNQDQHKEILSKNKQLEVQKHDIEEISEKRAEFFTQLAHEIRTPITLINNYIHQYLEKDKNSKHYQIITDNIGKLLHDIEFYLNAEKLQRNLDVFNHNQVINISKILANKVSLFNEYAKLKDIVIKYEIEPELTVKADPVAIDTVLNNLIDNAIKFSNANNEIIIRLNQRNGKIVFAVKDFGPGISENEQSKIFNKFYQGKRKNAYNKGLGIGLSIVSDIIKELDGMIAIKSKEKEGTEFMVTLLQHIPEQNEKLTAFEVAKVHVPSLTNPITDSKIYKNKKNLLLVEDNREMLFYLKEELAESYNIYVAECGNKALDKLVELPKPNLIITDVMMDNMDGFTFVETLTSDQRFKHIPVIFLTAKTTIADMEKGLELGAIDYINKPFSIAELKLKIESVLKNSSLQKHDLLQQAYKRVISEMGFQLKTEDRMSNTNVLLKRYKSLELTKREIEITNLVIEGMSNKEIGNKLNISMWTVSKHLQNIFDKANTNTRIELINQLQTN